MWVRLRLLPRGNWFRPLKAGKNLIKKIVLFARNKIEFRIRSAVKSWAVAFFYFLFLLFFPHISFVTSWAVKFIMRFEIENTTTPPKCILIRSKICFMIFLELFDARGARVIVLFETKETFFVSWKEAYKVRNEVRFLRIMRLGEQRYLAIFEKVIWVQIL